MIKQFIIFPSKVCVQQRGSAVIGAIIKGGGGGFTTEILENTISR